MLTKKFFKICCFIFFSISGIVLAEKEWNADHYVENSLLQFKWAKNFLFDRYSFSGNEEVLDIGCGDGKLTQLISSFVPSGNVLGIDKSFSMIKYATEKYVLNNLQFQVADASDISFYEKFKDRFDLIVSFHCLHWLDEQMNALLGMKKALKKSGKAFLRLTSKGWDPIQEIADELIQNSKWHSYFKDFKDPVHRYSKEEYIMLLLEAGLQPIRIQETFEDDLLPNIDVMSKQVSSWLPHVKHLPEFLQKEFLDDIIELYSLRVPPEPDGSIHLYDCYLEVELEKL